MYCFNPLYLTVCWWNFVDMILKVYISREKNDRNAQFIVLCVHEVVTHFTACPGSSGPFSTVCPGSSDPFYIAGLLLYV